MTRTFIFILSIILTSCFDLYEPIYWRDGKYSVSTSPSGPSCKDLNIDITDDGDEHGRVECVAKIGSNDKFIIVQSTGDQYWIIDRIKDNPLLNANEIVQGPFNLNDFKNVKNKLGIRELDFSKEFE